MKQHGPEWHGGCRIHGGKDDNSSINANAGMWYCHSQCGRGGSIYDFEMAITGADCCLASSIDRLGDSESRVDHGHTSIVDTGWPIGNNGSVLPY